MMLVFSLHSLTLMQVDLPILFYIDPEFADDPLMSKVDSIVLSYTFFEAKDSEQVQEILRANQQNGMPIPAHAKLA
jgi:cytochrome c oxidase assembly protein Cox11